MAAKTATQIKAERAAKRAKRLDAEQKKKTASSQALLTKNREEVRQRNLAAAQKAGAVQAEGTVFDPQQALRERERGAIVSPFVGRGQEAGTPTPSVETQIQEAPIAGTAPAPEVAPRTREEKAAALREEARQERLGLAGELGLPTEGIFLTDEELAQELQLEQKREKSELEQRIDELNRLDEAAALRERERGEAAAAGTTATFAAGREAIMGTSGPQVAREFAAQVETRAQENQVRLNQATQQRAGLLRRLEKAQKAQNESLVESIGESIAASENAIDRIQLDIQEAANEASRISTSLRNQAFDTFDSLPAGSLVDLSIEQIAGSFNIDVGTAGVMKSIDAQKREVELTDPDYLLKQQNLESSSLNARWSNLNTEQKVFSAFEDLLRTDPKNAAKFAQDFGLQSSSVVQQATLRQVTANASAVKGFIEEGVWNPASSVIPTTRTQDGIRIGVAEGDQLVRGQCGAFVNDVLNGGPGLFGDSFEEKKKLANSNIPIAGGAFIENLPGKTGHVGIVESVLPDGSFTIVDCNLNLDQRVQRDTVKVGSPRWKRIAEQGGFYNPSTPLQNVEDLEREAILSQIKSKSITNTQISEAREKAKREGWLPDFTKTLNDPKSKAITEKDAGRFNVPAGITQFQLDDIVSQRQAQGLGNREFQGFASEDVDKLQGFIELGRRLEDSRRNWEEFRELGGAPEVGVAEVGRTFQRFGATVPVVGPAFETKEFRLLNKLRADLGENLVAFIKEISGVAVSDPEFKRLSQIKPNIESQVTSQFEDQLTRAEESYARSVQIKLNSFGFNSIEQMKATISGGINIVDQNLYEQSGDMQFNDFYNNLGQ